MKRPEWIQDYIDKGLEFLPTLATALALLVIGWIVIGLVMSGIEKLMKRRNVDVSLAPFLKSVIKAALWTLLLIAVATQVGIKTTSFVAVLGALTFAIGFALQGSLANFAGGVLILLFKPFRVGDLIDAQGYTGVVESISVLNTYLLTPDNKTVILPNGNLSNSPVMNISGKGEIRVDMTFGIAYQDDVDKAKAVIQSVSDACPYLLEGKDTDIFVSELGDSSVNFAVRPWAASADYWNTYFYFHENIKKAFDTKGVNIPYPTMDVNVVKNN